MDKTSLGKKNKNYKQGIFIPKDPKKYKGSLPIIYRSGLELKAFRYLDNNPNVITWGSESIVVPYQSPADGKIHRYFVDLVAALKSKDGTIKKLLIEVKPEKQTKPPLETQRKKQKTIIYEKYQFATNLAKWEAAKNWCKNKGYTFIILNEKHLN
jgi:hypothetical protein